MAPTNVPMLDLKAQYVEIADEIRDVIERVVESQMFILGPEVAALEEEVAEYCQSEYCIGVSSGSDALIATLMAMDIGQGDEVITSPYTFFATGGAISRVGATPVFVDIEPESYNIDPARVADALTRRTRAIMPVHLYGQCADMDPINDIAEQFGLAVIEDACQAIGAEYEGKRTGSLGTAGCFSFFPSKNLGGFGDGGAITTDDPELAEKIRVLRMHGQTSEYQHRYVGGNFRLDALQAAILRVKLRHLDKWSSLRNENARHYTQLFTESGLTSKVTLPATVRSNHVFNQYVIRVSERDAVQAHLGEMGIGTKVYYHTPLHQQACFRGLGYLDGELPESERAAAETLALPIYPEMPAEHRERIVGSIANYFEQSGSSTVRKAA
ncbi:Aminotransferase [Planctomycetes bacterium Pan216]|uniref:Aminotransferase n=1 Tax=Kolteria novifilia TaxID=2527975 RepID=A0A518B0P6_9BACT|nr:Aminotransferase [Planctomycetes bacterium Pan216]